MNTVRIHPSWALFISVLMIAMLATAAAAQKTPPVLWDDTAINPHDFTDEFYASNGILSKAIIGRRTGTDLLSVYGPSSNPIHRPVRVLVTLPAYGPSEEMLFWYPLGEINDNGFTDDKIGVIAKEVALATPIYVFPLKVSSASGDTFSFNNMRQAALFGPSESYYPEFTKDALFVRRIVEVQYTDKAFDKDSREMIDFMLGKNGAAVDGLPIIRGMDDLNMLDKHGLVSFGTKSLWDNPGEENGIFALTPVIADPTGGVIAPDAFLAMATLTGQPLPSEEMFATEFGCLKKSGYWCKQQ